MQFETTCSKVTIGGNHGAQIKGRVLDSRWPATCRAAWPWFFWPRSAEDLTVEGHGMVSTTGDGTYTIKGPLHPANTA